MSTLHSLLGFEKGGLSGIQNAQRDWSPYLAHFTNYRAMAPLRRAITDLISAKGIKDTLGEADVTSFGVFQAILASAALNKARLDWDRTLEAVCFSECTLPGIFSLAEQFGRFGLIFKKSEAFALGVRPCIYLDDEKYGVLNRLTQDHRLNADVASSIIDLCGLANVLRPPGQGQIQDYTHQREWRHFGNVSFAMLKPCMAVCPTEYTARVRELLPAIPVLPLDMLFEWGA